MRAFLTGYHVVQQLCDCGIFLRLGAHGGNGAHASLVRDSARSPCTVMLHSLDGVLLHNAHARQEGVLQPGVVTQAAMNWAFGVLLSRLFRLSSKMHNSSRRGGMVGALIWYMVFSRIQCFNYRCILAQLVSSCCLFG